MNRAPVSDRQVPLAGKPANPEIAVRAVRSCSQRQHAGRRPALPSAVMGREQVRKEQESLLNPAVEIRSCPGVEKVSDKR